MPSDVKSLKKVISNFENADKLQNNMLKNYNVKNIEDLNVKQYTEILKKLNDWKNKE